MAKQKVFFGFSGRPVTSLIYEGLVRPVEGARAALSTFLLPFLSCAIQKAQFFFGTGPGSSRLTYAEAHDGWLHTRH